MAFEMVSPKSDSRGSHGTRHSFLEILVKHITLVQRTTKCTVNSGRTTAFWNDVWTWLGKLKEIFPNIYTFANNSSCIVRSQF
jgi:hypothetical protein